MSVIISAFNAEKWISDCVRSAIAQTYQNREIIVVDDGSTDNTASIVERQFADTVLLVRQPNRGQAAATARAFAQARGEFIAFLDSDDVWRSEKLEKQVSYLRENPDLVGVFTDAEQFTTFGVNHASYLGLHSALRKRASLMEAMVRCHIPLRSTLVLRREFLDRHGVRPDPEARSVDDVGLLMEILGRGGRLDLLDDVSTYRRMHEANVSSNHFNRFAWRIPMYHRLLDRCKDCDQQWKCLVRRALSDAEYRIGEWYWGRGDQVVARMHFHNALQAWSRNGKALIALGYTALPPRLAQALKRVKAFLRR